MISDIIVAPIGKNSGRPLGRLVTFEIHFNPPFEETLVDDEGPTRTHFTARRDLRSDVTTQVQTTERT